MISSAFMVTGFEPSTTPPDGPPTNATLYQYGGGFYGMYWTSGDTDAETEIAYVADPTGVTEPTLPSEIVTKVSAGVTGYETGLDYETCYWWIRHKRGGAVTDWVRVNHSFTCVELA